MPAEMSLHALAAAGRAGFRRPSDGASEGFGCSSALLGSLLACGPADVAHAVSAIYARSPRAYGTYGDKVATNDGSRCRSAVRVRGCCPSVLLASVFLSGKRLFLNPFVGRPSLQRCVKALYGHPASALQITGLRPPSHRIRSRLQDAFTRYGCSAFSAVSHLSLVLFVIGCGCSGH